MRATRLRAPSQLRQFDHRKFFVIDGRVGWIGGAGIEDHFDDGRFTTSSSASPGRSPHSSSSCSSRRSAGLGGTVQEAQLDELFPGHGDARLGPRDRPAQRPRQLPADRPAIARLLDDARETLDIVNPTSPTSG